MLFAKLTQPSRSRWWLLALVVGLGATVALSMAFTGEAQAAKHKHKGHTAVAGPPGPPGTALAFAHIKADGTFDASRSKNTRASTKVSGSPGGLYCIDFTVTPHNVVATLETAPTPTPDTLSGGMITQHTAGSGLGSVECADTNGTYNVQVVTRDYTGHRTDMAFDIAVN
jgi:hypothetical protein